MQQCEFSPKLNKARLGEAVDGECTKELNVWYWTRIWPPHAQPVTDSGKHGRSHIATGCSTSEETDLPAQIPLLATCIGVSRFQLGHYPPVRAGQADSDIP